jgi:hypothetical protein
MEKETVDRLAISGLAKALIFICGPVVLASRPNVGEVAETSF